MALKKKQEPPPKISKDDKDKDSTQRNEGDSGHRVPEAHGTPEQTRKLPHHRGESTDEAKGDPEARVASAIAGGRAEGKQDLAGGRGWFW